MTKLFEQQQQTVPQSQKPRPQLPTYKPLSISRQTPIETASRSTSLRKSESAPEKGGEVFTPDDENDPGDNEDDHDDNNVQERPSIPRAPDLIRQFAERDVSTRATPHPPKEARADSDDANNGISAGKKKLLQRLAHARLPDGDDATTTNAPVEKPDSPTGPGPPSPDPEPPRGDAAHVAAFNARIASQAAAPQPVTRTSPLPSPAAPSDSDAPPHPSQPEASRAVDQPPSTSPAASPSPSPEPPIPSLTASPHPKAAPGVVPNAFDRMRPLRPPAGPARTATITIGDTTTTATLGGGGAPVPASWVRSRARLSGTGKRGEGGGERARERFGLSLKGFAAPGTQASAMGDEGAEEGESEEEAGDEEEGRGEYVDDEAEEVDEEMEFDGEGREIEHGDMASDDERLQSRTSRPRIPDFDGPISGQTGDQPTQGNTETQAGLDEVASSSTPDAIDEDIRSNVHGDSNAESDSAPNSDIDHDGNSSSDGEYLDEAAKKVREDARVARMIQEAEARAALPSDESARRASQLLKGGRGKDATVDLLHTVDTSVATIAELAQKLGRSAAAKPTTHRGSVSAAQAEESAESAEAKLALTVSKEDFARMRVVGQFNLGFIIALRPASAAPSSSDTQSGANVDSAPSRHDELFIIDQHASDEKFNFERLARSTVLKHQRLVVPHPLELGAVEVEVAAAHRDALLKNGFVVDVANDADDGGAIGDDEDDEEKYAQAVSMGSEGVDPVGAAGRAERQRVTLLALPTSREVTFSPRDLEELLALLSDVQQPSSSPPPPPTTATLAAPVPSSASLPPASSAFPSTAAAAAATAAPVVRPSKVRRLLAMRACRSSVMIGRSLTKGQMARLVRHMGTMEKPWNCPHGRPTMRHVVGLGGWGGWREGDGVWGMRDGLVEREDGGEEEGGGEDWGDKGVWVREGGEVDWEGWLEAAEGEKEGEEDDAEDKEAPGEMVDEDMHEGE